MRCRRLVALSVGPLLAVGLLSVPPVAEAASTTPSAITSVAASPGSSPGTVVFTWQSAGKNTDHFLVETGLTSFSKSSSSSLPRSGRHAATFKISAKARSWTMSKADAATAGSPLGSANYLYFRFFAVNEDGSKTYTKAYPYLQAVLPKGLAASANGKGTDMRVASFNVRTVKATKDKRNWLKRVDDVAADILSTRAGVVLVQEASPGRADGKSGSTAKVGRQTTTLIDQLAAQGGSTYDYRMARTTSYLKSGLPRGTQGGRVLYDNKRYKLISDCPEKTGKKTYNAACSFTLPILSTDSEKKRRRGGYALLENRSSGQRFWAIAAHLDERHSSSKKTGPKYDKLRGAQADAIVSLVDSVNTKDYPVILGADINTWQNDKMGYSGHDKLIAAGFYDTLAAETRVNPEFTTSNGFKTTLKPNGNGVGSHLDVVMVKGGKGGADRWVNVMQNPDPERPSDHNLIYADITI